MQAVPRLKDARSRAIAGNVKMVMLLWQRAWGGGGLLLNVPASWKGHACDAHPCAPWVVLVQAPGHPVPSEAIRGFFCLWVMINEIRRKMTCVA